MAVSREASKDPGPRDWEWEWEEEDRREEDEGKRSMLNAGEPRVEELAEERRTCTCR